MPVKLSISEYHRLYFPAKSERTVRRMISNNSLPPLHSVIHTGCKIVIQVESCEHIKDYVVALKLFRTTDKSFASGVSIAINNGLNISDFLTICGLK